MLTKICNIFKKEKETWDIVRKEDATISSWKYGIMWAKYDCVVIHEVSNKGNKRYFMVELEGPFKDIKYPYDYDNKRPLVALEDIPKFPKVPNDRLKSNYNLGMSGDEIFEDLVNKMDIIKKTYLQLLRMPICSWRIQNQDIYISLRDAIADFECESIEVVQNHYEELASKIN